MDEPTLTPGADISGFTRSSRVGPRLEKLAIAPPDNVVPLAL